MSLKLLSWSLCAFLVFGALAFLAIAAGVLSSISKRRQGPRHHLPEQTRDTHHTERAKLGDRLHALNAQAPSVPCGGATHARRKLGKADDFFPRIAGWCAAGPRWVSAILRRRADRRRALRDAFDRVRPLRRD